MRHPSPEVFVKLVEPRRYEVSEIVTGRYGVADVAAQFTEARHRTFATPRLVRQDDRPAGRMTLLAGG